jgi:hypothetical protein
MKRTIVILSLLFCSCSRVEGIVDQKQFIPEHNYKLTVDKGEYNSYTIGDHYPHYERP